MNGAEVLVPIVMFAGAFAMIFGIVYLKTRENLAMVEKGMNPKQKLNRPAPFQSLKYGLLILGAGLGLLLAFFIDRSMPDRIDNYGFHHNGTTAIYFAMIAIGGGLGLVISYFIEKKEWYNKIDSNTTA